MAFWNVYNNFFSNYVGECHGKVVHLEDSDTKEKCLELCKSTSGNYRFEFCFSSCLKILFSRK